MKALLADLVFVFTTAVAFAQPDPKRLTVLNSKTAEPLIAIQAPSDTLQPTERTENLISCPDLTVNSFLLSGELKAKQGEAIGSRLAASVRNTGNLAVTQGFSVGFYLSLDSIITTDDRLLIGGREFVNGVVAGGVVNVSIFSGMSVPKSWPVGPVYLGVVLDEFDDVGECDESNNTAFIPITVEAGCVAAVGDLNADGSLAPADVVLLLFCVFLRTGNCELCFADVDCSGGLSTADVMKAINAVFLGEPFPC